MGGADAITNITPIATPAAAVVEAVSLMLVAHLTAGRPRATSLLATAAKHAITGGATSGTRDASRAGNYRAVGTLELDRAGSEEQGLRSTECHGATTSRGHQSGNWTFGLFTGHSGEARRGEYE